MPNAFDRHQGMQPMTDFNVLLDAMSPERRAEIARRVDEIHGSPLYRRRQALQFPEEHLAREGRASDDPASPEPSPA